MKSYLAEILSAALGVAVMCTPAHAKAPPGRFVVGFDPTGTPDGFAYVVDTKTKLTWQQIVTGPFAADELLMYENVCRHLDLYTGTTGWRMPTAKELFTLIDYAAPLSSSGPPALVDQTAFPDTPGDGFWSTTSSPLYPNQCVYFGTGSLISCGDSAYLRCVR